MESPLNRPPADDSYRARVRQESVCFRWRLSLRRGQTTLACERQGGCGLRRVLGQVADGIHRLWADHLLPMLLLGVIAAAFLFYVLGADITIVIGVLGIGCATAFVESANHRSRKR